MFMDSELAEEEILPLFDLCGGVVSVIPYGEGHINGTCLVSTDRGFKYILQRINDSVFHDVSALMRNIELVTEHLGEKTDDRRSVLALSYAKDGLPYVAVRGGYYRIYSYVENSICLERARSSADLYESALAFGRFSENLFDFDASSLIEIIPDFHNTPRRYDLLRQAITEDSCRRAEGIQKEIDFILEREEEMGVLQTMRENGDLPLRVTHNDAKLDNVLFDKQTGKALCVIDLDTVMPGLSAYDFGDSIRFGASTALEDEKNLSRVSLSLELFRAYSVGYRRTCRSLTDTEIDTLVLGAKTMTLECGMRFLTDYLDGDIYYRTKRDCHNLDRARTQLKLLSDMEVHQSEMEMIVHKSDKL